MSGTIQSIAQKETKDTKIRQSPHAHLRNRTDERNRKRSLLSSFPSVQWIENGSEDFS